MLLFHGWFLDQVGRLDKLLHPLYHGNKLKILWIIIIFSLSTLDTCIHHFSYLSTVITSELTNQCSVPQIKYLGYLDIRQDNGISSKQFNKLNAFVTRTTLDHHAIIAVPLFI